MPVTAGRPPLWRAVRSATDSSSRQGRLVTRGTYRIHSPLEVTDTKHPPSQGVPGGRTASDGYRIHSPLEETDTKHPSLRGCLVGRLHPFPPCGDRCQRSTLHSFPARVNGVEHQMPQEASATEDGSSLQGPRPAAGLQGAGALALRFRARRCRGILPWKHTNGFPSISPSRGFAHSLGFHWAI